MMQRGSLTLGFLSVLVGLLLSSFLGVSCYLSSRSAADRLETYLTDLLGATVRVEAASIGWMDGTRLTGLAISEASGFNSAGTPWLTVQTARTDVAALDWFASRHSADRIVLDGAAVTLRFDASGALLTRLPWPRGQSSERRLCLIDSRITLLQQGREPLTLSGWSGEIVSRDGALVLTGTVDDPERGEWEVTASLQTETREAELHLRTERTALDRAQLEALPFVSPAVWKQVRLDGGQTPVDFTLRFAIGRPGVHYQLELEPSVSRLHVTSINLDAENVSGRVRIEDGRVDLDRVQGQTGGGRIGTSGRLDFRTSTPRLNFQIDMQQVQLQQLPRTWKLPEQVAGRLTGKAELEVLIPRDGARTTGTGQGTVDQPLLPGLPLPIRLLADARGFHFSLALPSFPSFPRIK